MVECLYGKIKAALMSHADREHLVDNLLSVILGIRSTFKPYIYACSDELVYGSTLQLLEESLEQTTPSTPGELNDFLH